MKTILYNPIFINPQAYYVFPRLTRYLQPDNESTSEPANYIGTIEVKVIAYGDTTLKRTYTNTDSIDLSEFKNTWIRISLFTKVGSCVLGEWKIGNMESDLPYIDPEVLASLKAVVIVGNKTNNDSDRAIVKNLVDASNPFIISNAAFKLNSGFGKYEADFTNWVAETGTKLTSDKITNSNPTKNWIAYRLSGVEFKEMHIRILGIPDNGVLYFQRPAADGGPIRTFNGDNNIPAFTSTGICGFFIYNLTGLGWSNLVIEQIPSFEGAFVTDGIDDLITSTKTVQEMLGGSNEITVVSMIHQIDGNVNYTNGYTNYIRHGGGFIRNSVAGINGKGFNKTGIYGYTSTQLDSSNMGLGNVINNILGDKDDYSFERSSTYTLDDAKYSVQNFVNANNQPSNEGSSVAWYWTIIANKVLTTDQINQVIAYFNLDRTLKPDILCNVKKQRITNENHAEFGDKLIDFSGNGRDIQLNNLAWKGGSGIAAKQYETFKDWTNTPYQTSTVTEIDEFTRVVDSTSNSYWVSMINRTSDFDKVHDSINIVLYQDDMLLVHECKYKIDENVTTKALYETLKSGVNTITLATIDKFTDIPEDAEIMSLGEWVNPKSNKGSVKITLLPSYKGGLLLDGVNDFGKVTGMPIYKDYTVVTDREIFANIGAISSKNNPGAFVETAENSVYSFGQATSGLNFISTRSISYLSKYSYCGQSITAGAAEDGTDMWLGTIRDNDTRFFNGAIYSLMTFPYSMSEFLIERQLKKHKLGTLYPDMVEFRPVIKANANYKITYYQIDSTNTWKSIKVGDYIVIGAKLAFQITFDNDASELKEVVSPQLSGIIVEKRPSNPGYNIYSYITSKSPQKINITIDEYIRYEDIVQPYPVLLRFNDENGNEVSWGGKFKVGSTITRIGSIADPESNLLNGLYSISGLSLNGKSVTSSTSIVEKQMVFKTTTTYLLDNNEPKCILSPRLLRIPNSSYKILGHIPDISGHGNHGKINNSAYAGMSGANGYKQDFTSWKTSGSSYSIVTDSKYILTNEKAITNGGYFLWNRLAKDSFKVKISNIPNGGWMSYRYKITEEDTQFSSLFIRKDGIYTLPATIADSEVDFFISTVSAPAKDWIGLTIEQIGEYEGAYCLDGVDDFVTIPTLSSGGKQVLMKVNWSSLGMPIYEQRTPGKKNFAIISNSTAVAYIEGNDGNTYIDGILNNNIKGNELVNITHNITITNELSEKPNTSPMIGMNNGRNAFAKMALYDFMLFDEISTDDKIKELNEYVGVEAKIELPPYYWDAYGKTNLDADKATIQQRGIAVGDFDLTNTNFAYDNMSGFGGYTLGKFTNSWSLSNNGNSNSISIVSRNPYDITLKKLGGNSDWEFNTTELKIISNPVSVKFKSDKNIRFTCDYHYYTVGGNSEGAPLGITSKDLIANEDTIITISPISQENIDKYNIDINRGYYLIYFQLSPTLAVNEEVTIEMLPLYPNGLVLDGVEDFSKNANIPALTDYTYILKRQILKGIANSAVMYKGNITVNQGGAFICNYCEPSDTNLFTDFSFGGLLRSNDIDKPIIYGTKTSVNGDSITPGENIDTVGINVGKWVNYLPMVFYKLILYPKTIPLLQINFLKNLMEKDEIIDLNNPIFIQE